MNKTPGQKNKSIIQNSLKLIKSCPICAVKYEIEKVQVVDDKEDILVHFGCKNCHSSLLAHIAEMPFGVVGSAILTDLSAPEVMKFKNANAVSVDDVLEVYEKLEIRDKN